MRRDFGGLGVTGMIVGVNQIFGCRTAYSLFYSNTVRIIFVGSGTAVDSNRLEAVLEVIFISYGLQDLTRGKFFNLPKSND